MKPALYSFIIPVYNRPEEIRELLDSLCEQEGEIPFEVVVVEDGSSISSRKEIEAFRSRLEILYLEKPNTGPGDSRNYGMQRARTDFFLVLDSDCIIPPGYLQAVQRAQETDFLHCFGGPDTAHPSFSRVQRAINYAMTSFLSTGGLRGGQGAGDDFEPRSFNMGLSREAFEASGGFGDIHPGEDPDLSIRLRKLGYRTGLLPGAYVYHKRRVDFSKFLKQVKKFGMVRPILNQWHPETAKLTFWLPSLFLLGSVLAFLLPFFWHAPLAWVPLGGWLGYFLLVTLHSYLQNRDLIVALMSPVAVLIQFFGYGYGFLKSTILVTFNPRDSRDLFPELFFKKKAP